MTIKLLFFGFLAKELGVETVELKVPEDVTVLGAIETATETYPGLRPHLDAGKLAFALNMSFTSPGEKVSDGDELAIIPPVSGG